MTLNRLTMAFTFMICGMALYGGGQPYDATNILTKVQRKILSARTLRVKMREEVKGCKLETRLISKQLTKDVLSFRQEVHAVDPGKVVQPFIQVMNKNKLYNFPTGCGNVVVRMQFLEEKTTTLVARLFLSNGRAKLLKDGNKTCSIRYTCTPDEVAESFKVMQEKFGKAITRDMVPAVWEYLIDKENMLLMEMILYSDKGRLVKRQTFHDWKIDGPVADSNFDLPPKYRVYTAKTLQDAERIQSELVRKAMSMRKGK